MNKLSWKGETESHADKPSSIRGRISAPIPMSADDDEEFPIRTPGAGIATPLSHEGADKQLRLSERNDMTDETIPLEEVPEEPYRDLPPMPVRPEQLFETPIRPASGSRFRESDMTANPLSAKQELKRGGKKTSLRSVLGRLFGKKRRAGASISANGRPKRPDRADLHRSDPSALRDSKKNVASIQRSASMPINELGKIANSNATSEEEQGAYDEKPGSVLTEGKSRPRRATTPSRLYSPATTGSEWVGLTPRPASSHARSSVYLDESQVGQAITSGSHPNRRSRSMNHLRHPSLIIQSTRRRSEEIKYWRESYNPDPLSPLSPMSSQPAPTEQTTPHNEATAFNVEEASEMPIEVMPHTPEPFNFGLAGMKITQAASLETRVAEIEARIQRMEDMIANLVERTSPKTAIPGPPGTERSYSRNRPRTASNSDNSLPARNPDRLLHTSPWSQVVPTPPAYPRPNTTSTVTSVYSKHEATTAPSPSLSPRPAFSFPVRTNTRERDQEPQSRPLSTSTTIRGAPSSSPIHHPQHLTQPTTLSTSGTFSHPVPLSKHGSLTAHHYSALLNLITAESTARTILENQVLTLQRQLATVLSATAAPPQLLTNPSSPQDVTMHSVGEFSSFDHTESESEDDHLQDGPQHGYLSGDDEAEVFSTPAAGDDTEQWLSEEDFQREVREQEDDVRRANAVREQRTLSLSQMTMGRGRGLSMAQGFDF